jgi:hypothetical protein
MTTHRAGLVGFALLAVILLLTGCNTGYATGQRERATYMAERQAEDAHYDALRAEDATTTAGMATMEADRDEYWREQLEEQERNRRQADTRQAVCEALGGEAAVCEQQ